MKTNYKVAIALVAGAAIGGAAIQGLHAKQAAFVIAEVDVSNQDGFAKEYVPVAVGKALTESGCQTRCPWRQDPHLSRARRPSALS